MPLFYFHILLILHIAFINNTDRFNFIKILLTNLLVRFYDYLQYFILWIFYTWHIYESISIRINVNILGFLYDSTITNLLKLTTAPFFFLGWSLYFKIVLSLITALSDLTFKPLFCKSRSKLFVLPNTYILDCSTYSTPIMGTHKPQSHISKSASNSPYWSKNWCTTLFGLVLRRRYLFSGGIYPRVTLAIFSLTHDNQSVPHSGCPSFIEVSHIRSVRGVHALYILDHRQTQRSSL